MAEAPILIDVAKCVGCGKCVRGCGFGALKLVDRKAVVDASACKACSACVKACPFDAIREARAEVCGTEGIDDYRDIWVFAEQTDGKIAEVVFELLGKGLELKAQRGEGARLCAVLLGKAVTDEMTGALSAAGADVIYAVADPKLADYEPNVYVDAVAQLAAKHRPEVILAGATAIGRGFFARVAVKLRTGLTADCTALKIEETRNKDTDRLQKLLHQTRPAFGGNIMATIMTPNHRPQMATVRPKVFKSRGAKQAAGKSEIVREMLNLIEPKTRLVEVRRNGEEIDVSAATVLVAGGRGLKSVGNFIRLFELAGLLNGEVAASRAAVDAGWVHPRHQVGQTGKTVAPKLYLCFGISGAIQHLEGIRGADKIIAVNNDPNAPIFGVADLGIVGDAIEIIEQLIKELSKK